MFTEMMFYLSQSICQKNHHEQYHHDVDKINNKNEIPFELVLQVNSQKRTKFLTSEQSEKNKISYK